LPVLFTTGYNISTAINDADDPRAILRKPFTVCDLAKKVAEVLTSTEAA